MRSKKEIGLFGGSFNPVTKGHIEVANLVMNSTDIEEVWLVPCYNHLQKTELADVHHRLKMCQIAVGDDSRIKICDYEIKHGLDGSVYDFLNMLMADEDMQSYIFSFIIGADNVELFNTWRNAERLKKLTRFITVARNGALIRTKNIWCQEHPHIYIGEEVRNVSSTMVRNWLKLWRGRQWRECDETKLQEEMNTNVLKYIEKEGLYK